MSARYTNEEKKCTCCYSVLPETNFIIGVCDKCVDKELTQLKTRMIRSFIVSAFLIATVAFMGHYMRVNVYYTTIDGWDMAIIPFLFWDIRLNAVSVQQMLNPSRFSEILTYLVCFFFPFTSYVKIELKTYRHQAEANLWKRGATRDIVNATNTTRSEDAGLFIAEVILSAISGPYFFVKRFVRLWKLIEYKNKKKS